MSISLVLVLVKYYPPRMSWKDFSSIFLENSLLPFNIMIEMVGFKSTILLFVLYPLCFLFLSYYYLPSSLFFLPFELLECPFSIQCTFIYLIFDYMFLCYLSIVLGITVYILNLS